MTWLHDPTAVCACTSADVDHECATSPDRAGRITVTGYCVHGRAVAQTTDSIL